MLFKNFNLVQTCLVSVGTIGIVASALGEAVSPQPNATSIRGEPINAAPVPATAARAKADSIAGTEAAIPSVAGTLLATKPVGITESVSKEDLATKIGGYLNVGFDLLASFSYDAPDTPVTNKTSKVDEADKYIPDSIKSLDGKKVMVTGFMIPLRVEAGKAKEFLMMRNQGACCFGTMPKITEFITVKTTGNGVEPIMDVPINIAGTLHVGTTRENGYIIQIYRMDGEKIVNP
jgi:hypothetical protein